MQIQIARNYKSCHEAISSLLVLTDSWSRMALMRLSIFLFFLCPMTQTRFLYISKNYNFTDNFKWFYLNFPERQFFAIKTNNTAAVVQLL